MTIFVHGILPGAWLSRAAILVYVLLKHNVHIPSYFWAKVENMHVYYHIQTSPRPTIEMQLFPQAKAI